MRRKEFTEGQSTESQNFLISTQVAEVLNQESICFLVSALPGDDISPGPLCPEEHEALD